MARQKVYCMNFKFTSRVAIALICLFVFLSSISLLAPTIATYFSNETSGTRQNEEKNDVKLFFHRNVNTMDTIWNSTPISFQTFLNDGEEIEFTLEPALMGDLEVTGPNFGTKNGLEIWLEIRNPQINSDSTVTINIFDDLAVIATESFTIRSGELQTYFRIPFVESSKKDHVFSRGSVIKVNINASVGPTPIIITYDSGSADGYLILHCNQITKKTVAAHHTDGSLGEFYPNMPYEDQRQIQFRGSVTDTFGAQDISSVQISVEGLFDDPVDVDDYSYDPGHDTGHFTLDYTYDAGLTPGNYDITAYFEDYSNNIFLAFNSLSIATYGVYLENEDNPFGEGLPGEIVSFDIDVYNVGGVDDSIHLISSTESGKSGWEADFRGDDNTGLISPGAFEIKTLDITISPTAEKGEECIIIVKGESNGDSDPKTFRMDPDITITARSIFDFVFTSLNDLAQQIPTGGGAINYDFKLKNVGHEPDTYTVTGDSATSSPGWNAVLSTSNSNAVKVSDLEYTIGLEATEEATFTYTITAQANPSILKVELAVTAIDSNNTKTISHTTTTTIDVPSMGVTLSSTQPSKQANPGNSIGENDTMDLSFDFEATNQDLIDSYTVTFDVSGLSSDWDYYFTSDNIELGPEEKQGITIIFTIPETSPAKPDLGYTVTVVGTYGSNEQTNLDLIVKIPEVFEIELATDRTEQEVEAGNEVKYEISITNKGNVVDRSIQLTVTELSDWDVEISNPSITIGDYNSVVKTTVAITPSTSVSEDEKGIFDVKVKANGAAVKSNTVTLKTTVKQDVNTQLADFLYDYWFIPVLVIIIFILTFIIRSRIK